MNPGWLFTSNRMRRLDALLHFLACCCRGLQQPPKSQVCIEDYMLLVRVCDIAVRPLGTSCISPQTMRQFIPI